MRSQTKVGNKNNSPTTLRLKDTMRKLHSRFTARHDLLTSRRHHEVYMSKRKKRGEKAMMDGAFKSTHIPHQTHTNPKHCPLINSEQVAAMCTANLVQPHSDQLIHHLPPSPPPHYFPIFTPKLHPFFPVNIHYPISSFPAPHKAEFPNLNEKNNNQAQTSISAKA